MFAIYQQYNISFYQYRDKRGFHFYKWSLQLGFGRNISAKGDLGELLRLENFYERAYIL